MGRKRSKPATVAHGPGASAAVMDARGRLLMFGRERLADVELLALVLGGEDAMARALAVLHGVGGLAALDDADPRDLARVHGVGPAKAAAIVAALEIGRRVAQLAAPYARTIRGPEDVADFLRTTLGPAPRESFLVMGLDVRHRLQVIRTVAVGELASVHVHPREVFRPLVRAGMHSAILAHNHPGGEPDPSDADVLLTHRMVEVGRMVGIPVVDHIVVTRARTVSMAALGFLDPPLE
jgi:DNA repair protein RadC